MRSIWKGSISFGLVYIPVRLYTAIEDRSIHFNLLHERCGTRVRYRRWCDLCDQEIPAEEIVKAYRWAPDEYVVITEEDLAALPVPTSKTIEILDFVRLDSVDPIYFDKSYYLEPVEGGARAYALLGEAMRQTSQVALGKVAIRTKETLACLRVFDNGALVLHTMHYPDEIRSLDRLPGLEVAVRNQEIDQRELDLATELIGRLSSPFKPERYHDRYREALLARIDAKVRGEQIRVTPPPKPAVIDLMEALRASLSAVDNNGSASTVGSSMRVHAVDGEQ